MVVLRRKVRGARASGRRTDARRPAAQEQLFRTVAVRVCCRAAAAIRVSAVIMLVPLRWPRFTVARPRYDSIGRIGVLAEYAALERFARFNRLELVRSRFGVVRAPDGNGGVPVGIHGRTTLAHTRRSRFRGTVVVIVVVIVVLIIMVVSVLRVRCRRRRRLVDVFGRPVTTYRVHAVRNTLPRHHAAASADGAPDFLTRPRRRSFAGGHPFAVAEKRALCQDRQEVKHAEKFTKCSSCLVVYISERKQ